MIKADKSSLVFEGEATILECEAAIIVNKLYQLLKDIDEERAELFLGFVIASARMSKEEVHSIAEEAKRNGWEEKDAWNNEQFLGAWEKMMQDADDGCIG